MRIKGTKEHLKYHRRRLYRKYGTTNAGFLERETPIIVVVNTILRK